MSFKLLIPFISLALAQFPGGSFAGTVATTPIRFNGTIDVQDTTVNSYVQSAPDLGIAADKSGEAPQLDRNFAYIHYVPVNDAFTGVHAPFWNLLGQSKFAINALTLYGLTSVPKDELAKLNASNIALRLNNNVALRVPSLLEGFDHQIQFIAGQPSQPQPEEQQFQGGAQSPPNGATVDDAEVIRIVKLNDGIVVVLDRVLLPWVVKMPHQTKPDDSSQPRSYALRPGKF
jgi:hypothetical protein